MILISGEAKGPKGLLVQRYTAFGASGGVMPGVWCDLMDHTNVSGCEYQHTATPAVVTAPSSSILVPDWSPIMLKSCNYKYLSGGLPAYVVGTHVPVIGRDIPGPLKLDLGWRSEQRWPSLQRLFM